MKSICAIALERMKPEDIDHHGIDLYLRVNEVSKELVAVYDYKAHVKTFVDNIDHDLWFDIPFAWTGGDLYPFRY